MNSQDLLNEGFSKFGSFDPQEIINRKDEINFSGVYAFVLDCKFSRLIGETDILYIGQSGNRSGRLIYNRLQDYCHAYASAPQDKRISDSINRIKTKIRIARTLNNNLLKNKVTIYIKRVEMNLCNQMEKRLLEQFTNEHIELPPLNRSN